MDRYQKVDKPRQDTPIHENEIRITSQGRLRNYITYATTLLQEKGSNEVSLKALGRAINKTIMIAELIKRRFPGLHQNTRVGSTDITDTWQPLEEGLLALETTRHVSVITITLSKKELDPSSTGYQPPIPADQLKLWSENDYEDGYPSMQGRGRGRGRGNFNDGVLENYGHSRFDGWHGYGGRNRGRSYRGLGRGYGGRRNMQPEPASYNDYGRVAPAQGRQNMQLEPASYNDYGREAPPAQGHQNMQREPASYNNYDRGVPPAQGRRNMQLEPDSYNDYGRGAPPAQGRGRARGRGRGRGRGSQGF